MTENRSEAIPDAEAIARLDTGVAHIARVYDYVLGGTNNFAADRAAAEEFVKVMPGIVAAVQEARAFLVRVVRFLAADAGIRQFLDIALGSGHPGPLRPSGEASLDYLDSVRGEVNLAVARGGDDRAVPPVELAGGDRGDMPWGKGQPDPGRPVERPLLGQPQGAVPDAAVIAEDEGLDPLGRQ